MIDIVIRVLVSLTLSLFVSLSVTAVAQPAKPAETKDSKAMVAQARELYVKGNQHFERGDAAKARAAFAAAFAIHPHHQIAGALAAAELELGNYVAAATHIAFYQAHAPDDEPPERLKNATDLLEKASAHVATVNLTVNVNGASATVDGEPLEKVPTTLFLVPGPHTFAAKHHAYEPTEQTVTLAAGTERMLELVLLPTNLVPPPIEPQPDEKGSGVSVPILAAGGALTTVTLGLGVGLMVAGFDQLDESLAFGDSVALAEGVPRDGFCNEVYRADYVAQCDQLKEGLEDSDTLRNAGVWMFIISGLAAAGTATYWIVSESRDDEDDAASTIGVTVIPTPGGAAVVAGGTW